MEQPSTIEAALIEQEPEEALPEQDPCLAAEEFDLCPSTTRQWVELPEWGPGRGVWVWEPDLLDLLDWEAARDELPDDAPNRDHARVQARLLTHCVRNSSGTRLFSADQFERFLRQPPQVFSRLRDAALEVLKHVKQEADDVAGKSETDPHGDSPAV